MEKRILGIVIAAFLCLTLIMSSLADQIVLPSGTTVIEDEAFYGDQSLTELVLPEGLLRIGSKAFASTSLHYVVLPRSLQYFAPDAFDFDKEDFEFYVYNGSDAAQLSAEYGLQPKIIGGNKVGVSMPTKDLQRWNQDGANLKSNLEGYGYEVDLQYASNDVPTQLAQIETMIDDGARVLVIAAIEGSSLGQVLSKAAEKGVKVIAYDRLLMDTQNVDYYITFDNYKVGTVQGTYVKDALKLDSATEPFNIEFTAGDPGDNNASYFYNGAMDVLRPYIQNGKLIVKSGQTDFSSVATPDWNPATAQKRAEDILSAFYYNGTELDAWVCSNDSTALGVTNALKSIYTGKWPVITGQDCDLQNVKNILAGKQSMSVFKDTRILAAQAAKMVDQIMNGKAVDVNDTETYNNNSKVVPTYLCAPVFCDANNYRKLLIDSGYYTEEDLGGVSPQPTLTYRIGVSIYAFADNFMSLYRNELLNYFMNLGTDNVKYEISITDACNDMAKQIDQVRNFIAQDMDVIILNLVQTASADNLIDEVTAAGIPLVLINREPVAYDENGNRLGEYERITNNPTVCYVGTDASQAGTFQGEIVRDLNNHGDVNGDGKISYIIIEGDPENVDAQCRTTFSVKALTDAGYEVECLDDQVAYWDQTAAQEICANALNTYGDKIEVVFCNNDGMALGAASAIQAAGRKVGTDIFLLGIDALEEAVELIKQGDMTGTVQNDYIGQSHAAADVAVKLLNGQPVANYYWIDYVKIVNSTQPDIDDPVTLTYAEVNPIEGTVAGEMAKAFKEKAEQLSNGSVLVDIQGAGVLGSESAYLDDILFDKNSIDVCRVSSSLLSQYGCKKANLLSLPYMFENREHFWNFANSNLAKDFLNEPHSKGLPLRGLAFGEEGFRCFFFISSVSDVNDLNGLKIRVTSDPIMTGLVSGLGAEPTLVSFSKLYNSLQAEVVDGSEQALANYRANSFYEVAPYLLMDEHTVGSFQMIISDAAWDKLSEQQQGWVQEAASYASNKCREASETKDAQVLQALGDRITIIEVPDKTPWREAAQAVITENLNGEEAAYQSILALR